MSRAEVTLNNETTVINSLTNSEKKRLDALVKIIKTNQTRTEGYAESTAFALWEINNKKLYRGDGYSGIGPYAQAMFGISKGTTSSAIAVVDRFSDETHETIREPYRYYKFSTLMIIKSLSDAEIEANIPSDCSRDRAKEIVQRLNAKSEEEKLAINTRKEIDAIYKEAVVQGTDKELLKEQVEERVGFKANKDCTQEQLELLKKELSDITGISGKKKQETIYLIDYIKSYSEVDILTLLRDLNVQSRNKDGVIVKLMPERVETSRYNMLKKAMEQFN